jgi:hypothetical protein
VRAYDAGLVKQRQLSGAFEYALDHEHHIRAACIVLVEHQSDVVLIGPGQNTLFEFGDLLAFLQDDGILADQVDARDVAVEVDPHTGPVEARGHLFDVR